MDFHVHVSTNNAGKMSTHGYIHSIHMQGIEKRYIPSKHYVYILEVHWSDATVCTIYRKYSDFFNFHISMFELFPEESGKYEESKRILPYLPGRKIFREVEKIATQRQADLMQYCQDLIALDSRISLHEHVTKFFEARKDDLNPPSEARIRPERSKLMRALELIPFMTTKRKKKQRNALKMPRSTSLPLLDVVEDTDMCISGPIILQTYRAVASYRGESETDASFVRYQLVDVIEKSNTGWWFVQTDDGQGWAPASHLEPFQSDTEVDAPEPLLNYEQYLVMKNYRAELKDEITIKKGAIVNVMHKLLDGWWIIHHNGKVGYVPATYLVPYGSCGSLHSGLTLEDSSNRLDSVRDARNKNTPIKPPAQRRCTIKSRKFSDKERQQSEKYLSMCKKINMKLEQRQQRISMSHMKDSNPTKPPDKTDESDVEYENDIEEWTAQSDRACSTSGMPGKGALARLVPLEPGPTCNNKDMDDIPYEVVDMGGNEDYLEPINSRNSETNRMKPVMSTPADTSQRDAHKMKAIAPPPESSTDANQDYYNMAPHMTTDKKNEDTCNSNSSNSATTVSSSSSSISGKESNQTYENIPRSGIRKHRKTLEPPNTAVSRKTMLNNKSPGKSCTDNVKSINKSSKPPMKPKPNLKPKGVLASRIAQFENEG